MATTLEEMRDQWQQLNRRLDDLTETERSLAGMLNAQRLQGRVRAVSVRHGLRILLTALALLVTGSSVAGHLGDISMLAFPAALHVILVIDLIHRIWSVAFTSRLSWHRPVVEVQREVLRLRRATNRMNLAWLMFWVSMHVPLLFWLIEWFSGYDAYADPQGVINDAWVIMQWAVVVVLALFVYWVLRYHRDHPWVAAVIRDSAGRSLNDLDRDLAELDALR